LARGRGGPHLRPFRTAEGRAGRASGGLRWGESHRLRTAPRGRATRESEPWGPRKRTRAPSPVSRAAPQSRRDAAAKKPALGRSAVRLPRAGTFRALVVRNASPASRPERPALRARSRDHARRPGPALTERPPRPSPERVGSLHLRLGARDGKMPAAPWGLLGCGHRGGQGADENGTCARAA